MRTNLNLTRTVLVLGTFSAHTFRSIYQATENITQACLLMYKHYEAQIESILESEKYSFNRSKRTTLNFRINLEKFVMCSYKASPHYQSLVRFLSSCFLEQFDV